MPEIRRAKIEDAKELSELIYSLEAFSAMQGLSREELFEVTKNLLIENKANPNYLVWVAAEPKLLAYVVLHIMPNILYSANDAFISELFVADEARGRGLGSKLLDKAIAEAKSRNCFRIQLLNVKAREAYQRGFYKKQDWHERKSVAVFRYELRK